MPPQSALLRTAFRQLQFAITRTGVTGSGSIGISPGSLTRQGRRVLSTASNQSPSSSDRIQETFLNGTSSVYAEQMFELYQHDPSSVHASWKKYFENLEQGVAFQEADFQNPTTAAAARKVAVRARVC